MNGNTIGMERAVRGAYSRGFLWDIDFSPWKRNGYPGQGIGHDNSREAFLSQWANSPFSKKLEPTFQTEFRFLNRERDPELFSHGLLQFARRLKGAGRGEAALFVLEYLQGQENFPAVRSAARQEAQLLQGRGNFGVKFEGFLGRLAQETTDPSALAAMGAAALTGSWMRWRSLGYLLGSPRGTLWNRGWGARSAAFAAGMAVEVPAFTLARRGVDEIRGRSVSWDVRALGGEMGSATLWLGSLRLTGGGRNSGFLLPQGRMYAGLLLAHRLEQGLGWAPPQDLSASAVDALAMLIQFNVAGRLSDRLWGGRLSRFQGEVEKAPSPYFSHLFRGRFPGSQALAIVGGHSLYPSLPQKIPPSSPPVLHMSSLEGTGGPVRSLEDLPQIRRALLPQWKDRLQSDPRLSGELERFGTYLKRLNDSLKDERFPGAAPFHAGEIAQSFLSGYAGDQPLAKHPIPRLVAMSLAAHYEAIGDFLGHHIHSELNTAYEILGNGRPDRFLLAEKIVLEGLELDPFNPWLIQLGLEVSRSLGDLALRNTEHYLHLQKEREGASRKWKDSTITRKLREDVVEKFQKHPLQAGWRFLGHIGKFMILLMNPFLFLSEKLPGFFHFLHYLARWKKFGKDAVEIPGRLKATQMKTLFEINLYHGNYRNAVVYAPAGAKIQVVWGLLERRALSMRMEKKIELEPIPQLRPEAAPQFEALQDLKKSLALSRVVSLEGIPGSAKTYLAVQLASEIRDQSGPPVFWYTFRERKKPDLERFANHLAHFLDLQKGKSESRLLQLIQENQSYRGKADLLREALDNCPCYLFLDNFHVVPEDPEASQFFRYFFQNPVGAKVITINQKGPEWLSKLGAQVFHRERMTYLEAFEIFKRLGADPYLSEDQLREAYIATKGRPMALTLFGVLAKSVEPPVVERMLSDLGTKKNRAETLKYLFDRVYEALTENQQRLLQYLSLFRGTVTPAALTFFGPQGEAAGAFLLLPLKELFLLEEPQPGNFRVHERFRSLAALYLQGGAELHHRAAEYYRSRGQEANDYLEAAHHYVQAGDFANALRMISGRTRVFLERGYEERVAELFGLLEGKAEFKGPDLAGWQAEKAELLWFKGREKDAVDLLRRALSQRRRLEDHGGMGRLYNRIGQMFIEQKKHQRALNYLQAGLDSMEKTEDWRTKAELHGNIGRIYREWGQMSRASLSFLRSLAIQKTLGDPEALAQIYFQLGLVEVEKGNREQARNYLNEAWQIFHELGRVEAAQIEAILRYHP